MNGFELRDRGLEQAGSGAPVSVLVSWQDRARVPSCGFVTRTPPSG
jgi:hypothetical protein